MSDSSKPSQNHHRHTNNSWSQHSWRVPWILQGEWKMVSYRVGYRNYYWQ